MPGRRKQRTKTSRHLQSAHRRRGSKGPKRADFTIETLEPRILLTADLSQLQSNLDATFTRANTVLQSDISATPLPFVANKIGADINTLTALQSTFDSALGSITSQSQPSDVVTALQKALGTNATVTIVQGPGTTDEFIVTQSVASAPVTNGKAIDFSLGLPALNMTGNIALDVSLGYQYSIDFGVDATNGFFVSTAASKTYFDFTPQVAIAPGSQLAGTFGQLALTATDDSTDTGGLNINPTKLSATYAETFADGGSGQLTKSAISSAAVNVTLTGLAHLALNATLGASGANAAKFPTFSTVFTVDWNIPQFNLPSAGVSLQNLGQAPTVGFGDVSMDLGSAISGVIGPVINDLYQVLKPIKPIVDFINEPMPVFNDVGVLKSLVGDEVDLSVTHGVCTVGDFFEFLADIAPGDLGSAAATVVTFAADVEDIYTLYSVVNGMDNTGSIANSGLTGSGGIDLGSYTIGNGGNISGDLRAPSSIANLDLSNVQSTAGTGIESQLQNLLGSGDAGSDFVNDVFGDGSGASDGLAFPLLTDPGSVLGVLLGQNESFFTFSASASFGIPFSVNVPILGPLVLALRGNLDNNSDAVSFSAQFSCGYDTYGLTESTPNPLDGFYISDSSNVTLSFGIAADAALDLLIVEAGIGGGIQANVSLSLNDPNKANDGGKLRYSQILLDLQNGPLGIFDFSGELTASLNAFVTFGISPFSWTESVNFASVTLLDFNCEAPAPDFANFDPTTGVATLCLNQANVDTSGSNAGFDNFTITDLGPDKTAGGEVIDISSQGNDQVVAGVKEIYGEGGSQAFDLNIEPGVTAPIDIAGGYFPSGPNAMPTGNTVRINDQGTGQATIYASDGDDQIYVKNADAVVYGGDVMALPPYLPFGLTYTSDDVIQLGTPSDGGLSTVFGGTATNETIIGGGGNAIINVGDSANALVDCGGGSTSVFGGTGKDHFVVNFAQQDDDTITANPAGTNSLEVDGGGGGEDIDVESAGGGWLQIDSVLGGIQDSVLARNFTVLDIEPAPGLNSNSLTVPGPAPSTSPINITVGDLNGTGLQTLCINMLGTTSGAQQVCPINSTITGSGNDNITVVGTVATVDGQSTGGSSTIPPAQVYQITSIGSGLTIFATDGPGNSLAYNVGYGSNTVTLDNVVEPGNIVFNSLQNSSGTDTYNITSAAGPVAINQDGKDLVVSIGSPAAGLGLIQWPVTIGGAIADRANQDGYDGTLDLTIDDAAALTGGTGTLDDGSFSGLDLGSNAISWTYATSLDVLLGNYGNDLTVDLTIPISSVTIQAGNGNDTIDAGASWIPMILLGGAGNDTFIASNNGDYISGGGGSDKIYEGVARADGGDDTIIGGDGSNVIVEDGATALIYGNDPADEDAAGGNTISGTAAAVIYTGPNRNTVLFTGGAIDIVYAGGGDDSITVGDGDDFIYGAGGNDTIKAGNGNDFITAGDGNDNITAGDGVDAITVDNGNDNISAGNGNDVISAGTGTTEIAVKDGNSLITANGDDTITAGGGNNEIHLGAGKDAVNTGAGQDIVYGGSGNDTINCTGENAFIYFADSLGIDTVSGAAVLAIQADANFTLTNGSVSLNDGFAGEISIADVALVSLTGGAGDNTFDVSGWTGGPVEINGGGGSDTISSTDDTDFTLTDSSLRRSDGAAFALSGIVDADLTGGGSDNTFDVTGWTGGGTISGDGGVDTVIASNITQATLSDTVLSRAGATDLDLVGISQADLTGSAAGRAGINAAAFTGSVALFGVGSDNTLTGGSGSDYIVVGAGSSNTLIGNGSEDNQIIGGTGIADTIDGGPGENLLVGSSGGYDVITTGAGVSHVYTPGGNDFIKAELGGAIVYAYGSGDTVETGSSTSDQVLHPGDPGTTAGDFVATASGDPWEFPQLAAPVTGATLPAGPDSTGQWVEYASSASGGGVSNSPAAAIEPSIVVSGSGASADEFVAWADNRTGTYEIYVAEHTAAGWEELDGSAEGGGISDSSIESRRPNITLDAYGNPIVVWTEIAGPSMDIYAARLDPTANGGQGAWVAMGTSLLPGGLSGTGSADDAQVVNTGAGPVVAWLNSGGVTNVYALRFDGANWDELGAGSAVGKGVSDSAQATSGFSLATDGTNIAVAWTQPRTAAGSSVYLRQYGGSSWSDLDGSASGDGVSGADTSSMPSIAYAGGTLYAAWAADTDGRTNVVAAGYAGATWTPISIQTPAGAGVDQVSRGAASDPVLSSNGSSVDLVWIEDRLPDAPDQAVAIYANRLQNGAFVYQLPGDSSFNGILGRSTSLSQPATLAMAMDQAGHPFVTWGDSSSGSSQAYMLADTLDVKQVIYVNGELAVDDCYATASGNASNNGLTPGQPLASIQAALNLPSLARGDVILVDRGAYGGFTAGAADDGVLIVGSPLLNTQITGAVALAGAQDMTLDSLTLSGGASVSGGSDIDFINDAGSITLSNDTGVLLAHGTLTGLTLAGNTAGTSVVYNSITAGGLNVDAPATGLLVSENNLSSLALNAASQGGITGNNINGGGMAIDAAFTGSIDHNLIHGATVGVTYSAGAMLNANEIYDNTTGVVDNVDSDASGLGFMAGSIPNEIFANDTGVDLTGEMQDQEITANNVGVTGSGVLGGTSLAAANQIEGNAVGVDFDGTVQYNCIDYNGTSIVVQNGQIIDHNLIYDNGGPNIQTLAASDVEIVNNTFYSPDATNIQVNGGSANVEILNNVLWTGGGYDLDISTDSRNGFYSDYNDLYTTGSGQIVHYLGVSFGDILDWQDDVVLYDLHSIGTTAVNPAWAQPQFVGLGFGDFTVYPTAAGLRSTSPTIGTGDPITDLCLPSWVYDNLLLNPSFESGASGWTVSTGGTTQSSAPGAFEGTSYFDSGAVASGFAQQTIGLISAGYTAAQIDAGTMDISFGGRIRSALESPVDQGQLVVTFLDGSGQPIGSPTVVSASNTTDRWELVGARVHVPVGARSVTYRFQSVRESGITDNSYLDAAFLYVPPNTTAADMGAYGTSYAAVEEPVDEKIQLQSPDLYVNWTLPQSHPILWSTFGNTGDVPVRIDLYQETAGGLQFLLNITPSTADNGSYAWVPQDSGLTYGTYGLRIKVSLVGESAIQDMSTESFTIPENGNTYYVNDGSTAGDQYTTAAGSNRATGKLASAPLPLLTTLLRTYSLGSLDTVYVDTGTYDDFAPVELSGNPAIGSGQGVTIIGPTDGQSATIDALGSATAAVVDVNDANYVTLSHLGFAGADYGVWVHDASSNFTGSSLTVTDNSLGGIRLESDSTAGAELSGIVADNNTGDGVYAGGPVVSLTSSTSYDNTGDGFDLANSGAAVLTGDAAYGNEIGLYILNETSGTTTDVGNANLALGLGNEFYDNEKPVGYGGTNYGIYASGHVLVAGNTVYGQTAVNNAGIDLEGGATATENVVYDNYDGIRAPNSPSTITYNLAYDNSDFGIESDGVATLTGNVAYSNGVGIRSFGGPAATNNLVYENSIQGIWLTSGNYAQIYNNTVYQLTGDAVLIDGTATGIGIENNILWAQGGYDISVDSTSETGFKSDYNDLYTGADKRGGTVGLWESVACSTLASWQSATGNDADSISANPLFVNIAGGDFHEQSTSGSFHNGSLAPVLGGWGLPVFPAATLTPDANESPAIDRGATAFSCANEPTPNGGYINLGAYGNTAQASLSPASGYVLVLKPADGATLFEQQNVTITWRSQDAAGTVNIDLLQGSTVVSIASVIANSGSYVWTIPTSLTPGGGYTIRVTRNGVPSTVGLSGTFTLNAAVDDYYVNGSSTGGQFTTAGGSDSNSGLDSADPMATIQALLASYQLGAGDTIFVDQGAYNLSSNIILTAANTGLTIEGAPGGGTILNRLNVNTGNYAFDLQTTAGVTLESLTITGGYYGINASWNSGSTTGLTVTNCTFYGSEEAGISLANNYSTSYVQTGDVITGDVFHDMLTSPSYGYGITTLGDQVTISDNVAYDLGTGLYIQSGDGSTISGNTAYDDGTGIWGAYSTVSGNIAYSNYNGIVFGGSSNMLTGNTAYDNRNIGIDIGSGTASGDISYGNLYGIYFTGQATASDNLIYNNTTAGIYDYSGSSILGNVLYGNGWGLSLSNSGSVENNLVYNNILGGVSLSYSDSAPILNNTVYQTGGVAVYITGGSASNQFVLRDNIIWDIGGTDMQVSSGSQQSVASDYNDLYTTGGGQIGLWGSTADAALTNWEATSGMDADSISANPLFVNPGVDFHEQSQSGSYHGGTLAPILNAATGLPEANPFNALAPIDDASESPAIDRGCPTDSCADEPAPNGGYVNLGAYGNTSQASLSPQHYLFITNPTSSVTAAAGQSLTVQWRDEVSNLAAGRGDTDTVELLYANGSVALTASATDVGTYVLSLPSTLTAGAYQVKAIRNDGTGLSSTSSLFNIAAFDGIYYVNGAAAAGQLTAAGGSDSNSGLDPASPKATIAAILNSYTMQPGNVIMVDEATYNLSTNLVLAAADSGITIEGVAGETILNRGNTTSGAYVFDLQGATGVTLENLSITGACYGVNASYGVNCTGLTVTGCSLYGDEYIGIDLGGGNNGVATITNNTFDNMLYGATQTYGLEIYNYAAGTITGNTTFGLACGFSLTTAGGTSVTISNNTTYLNYYGIYAYDGSTGTVTVNNNNAYDNYAYNLYLGGAGLTASGNNVYEDGGAAGKESSGEAGILISGTAVASNNTVYGNVIGIEITGNATVSGNRVYNDSTYGIESTSSGAISGNSVYSNGTWGIYGLPATVSNNLVYANGSGGIYLSGDYTAQVLSNTVYQATGDAFRLDGMGQNGGTAPAIMVQNNILWASAGPDLLINDAGEASLASDYNDLYATGTGELAQMAGVNFTSLSAWDWELGLDVHSISADPQFVNAAAADFHVQSTSPTIDAGNPASEFASEPAPNGGRINLGYDGDTAQAATSSSATTLQVTYPTGLQKLQVGQPTTIQWLSTGLLSTQTITEVAAGESAPVGEYHADEFQIVAPTSSSITNAINTSLVANPALQAVYQTFVYAASGIGNYLSYLIPVPDGTYTIRLDWAEPWYGSVGARTFDVLLQGQVVQSAFDVYNAAGKAMYKAVSLTFAVTASGGSGISLQLKNDTVDPAFLNGFEISAASAGGAATQTANVQVSTDSGNTWNTVAANQPMDAEGRGSYVWTPTTSTSGATALVRVVANNAAATTGVSGAFPIANGGTAFYVSNSTMTTGNQYTSALGNNANSGKSPDAPMASIEAVLNDYQPGAGDTIYVDNGTYTLFHNINIPAIDSGVTITGPTASGTAAVLNRNSIAVNDYVFCFFDGANNVTLEHLSITGANTGIYAPSKQSLGNSGITIADNLIYSNDGAGYSGGIFTAYNSNWTITGNVIHDNTGWYGGIYLQATTATITNNTVYNEPQYDICFSTPSGALPANNVVGNNAVYGSEYGIYAYGATVSNNLVHDNTVAGIDASNYSVVTGNTVWRQTATNAYGIELGSSTVSDNAVFGNYNGIFANGGAATINGNRIYSNTNYGLLLESMNGASYAGGPNYYATAYGNTVYANSTGGIYLSGNMDLSLLNNTVYQPVGNAVTLSGPNNTTYPVFIENNILWVQAGYDLYVPTASQAGLVSNYNILYHTGNNANVGTWNGASEATLAAWQGASGLDSHSSEANPLFVDPAGADGVLGYNPTAQNGNGYNGGGDDNFFVSAGSPAIGAGNPAIALPIIAPAADLLGYAFHLDIGAYAYRGTAAQSTTPPTVTSVTSATIGPSQITVVFSQTPNDIDAAAASLYSLVGAGPDGIFGTSDDVVYSLTPTYRSGTNQVVLAINGGPLPTGLYKLTIASNANSSVHNLAGVALAGGGTAGTNYVTTFNVGPTVPTITWPTPAAITYGTALSGAQLDASAGVAGSFAYGPGSGTVLGAGTQTLSVTFTPTDTTDYTTATDSVLLTVDPASLTVTANPASKTYGAANPTFADTVTGFVNGDTSGVVSGAANLTSTTTASSPVGIYTITAASGTLSAANYTFATFVNGVLTITRATPTVTLASPPATITYDGTGSVTDWVQSTLAGAPGAAAPTGAVTYAYYFGSTTTGTPLDSPPVDIGTYTVVANYVGDTNYLPAASSPVTFVIQAPAVPLAPSGLVASPVCTTEITLSWVNNATNQTGFNIYEATDSNFSQNLHTYAVGANTTMYNDAGLTPGTTYYFGVEATNAGGDSTAATVKQMAPIPGDINCDGLVDVADYDIWAANVGRTNATWSQGDLNGDGLVDVADYDIWAANVGNTASSAAVAFPAVDESSTVAVASQDTISTTTTLSSTAPTSPSTAAPSASAPVSPALPTSSLTALTDAVLAIDAASIISWPGLRQQWLGESLVPAYGPVAISQARAVTAAPMSSPASEATHHVAQKAATAGGEFDLLAAARPSHLFYDQQHVSQENLGDWVNPLISLGDELEAN